MPTGCLTKTKIGEEKAVLLKGELKKRQENSEECYKEEKSQIDATDPETSEYGKQLVVSSAFSLQNRISNLPLSNTLAGPL